MWGYIAYIPGAAGGVGYPVEKAEGGTSHPWSKLAVSLLGTGGGWQSRSVVARLLCAKKGLAEQGCAETGLTWTAPVSLPGNKLRPQDARDGSRREEN